MLDSEALFIRIIFEFLFKVEQKECGCGSCDFDTETLMVPIGSIIPWVTRPNLNFYQNVDFRDWPGWILCDGNQTCSEGPYKGQYCTDLSGRALIGSFGSYKQLDVFEATIPNHHHSHTHTTKPHSHGTNKHSHTRKMKLINCGAFHGSGNKWDELIDSNRVFCQFETPIGTRED